MLIIDDLTLIICGVLVLFAVLSVVLDTFIKRMPDDRDEAVPEDLQPVSVIVIADNNSRELDKHLSVFLSQDYPAGYEVIVVVSKDEDETDEVLKKYARHANFYTTFVPDSSRYMSRHKLAITLGVKAAKNNLILLTNADCCPVSDRWITSMVSAFKSQDADVLSGYSNYDSDTDSFRVFERLHREYAFMCEMASGRPYATAGSNLMFRKDMFMQEKGFQGNLKYLRGEYEFLVNKYGRNYNVAVTTAPESYLTEVKPTQKAYVSRGIFYAETRKHLLGGALHRAAFNADMWSLHLCLLLSIGGGVFAGLTSRWIELGIAVLTLVIPCVARTFMAKRAIRFFDVPTKFSMAFLYELRFMWHSLVIAIRHKRADKVDFICHKS